MNRRRNSKIRRRTQGKAREGKRRRSRGRKTLSLDPGRSLRLIKVARTVDRTPDRTRIVITTMAAAVGAVMIAVVTREAATTARMGAVTDEATIPK
jgi:hypothetical protein